jgi:hypothetical protein
MSSATKLALDLGAILKAYVQVHDDIYKFSLRRVLPIPGVFQPIRYCEHEKSLSSLSATIVIVRSRIYDAGHSPAANSAALLQVMGEYTDVLLAAITKLRDICARFCASTKGQGSYSMPEFNAATRDYNSLVERYRAIGLQLNELYARHHRDPGD